MAPIQPFQIAIPDSKLERLHKKLELADFPDELEDAGWTYGAPLSDVKRLAAYWQDGFDWRATERRLNELPQFTTTITVDKFEPLAIHFLHQKSSNPNSIPLLFIHGWPGSYLEVTKLLPLLANPTGNQPSFHAVAPSLPNYGFSQGTKRKHFGLAQMASACHQVMLALGYESYVCQGGDWGWRIGRTICKNYPQHCKAMHTNFPTPPEPKLTRNPLHYLAQFLPWSEADKKGFERSKWFDTEQYGYNLEQSTKPQTIGYSQADSPVGLLAWIYEKLHDWSDNYPWTDDEILTWVSIYWFSRAGPAAPSRIYFEAMNSPLSTDGVTLTKEYVDVPLGVSISPKELRVGPLSWCSMLSPVVFEKRHEIGGHFLAWEHPDFLAEDLRTMFGKGGGAYGVVAGKSGYAPKSNSARL